MTAGKVALMPLIRLWGAKFPADDATVVRVDDEDDLCTVASLSLLRYCLDGKVILHQTALPPLLQSSSFTLGLFSISSSNGTVRQGCVCEALERACAPLHHER